MVTRLAVFVALACLAGGVAPSNADGTAPVKATGPTYAELPLGAPTTMPWWQARRLHIGETTIQTRSRRIVSRNGTTAVSAPLRSGSNGQGYWFLVVGTQLVQLPMKTPGSAPLMSANGRWIAWLEVRARNTQAYRRIERYRVVVYDVVNRRTANTFRDRRMVAWEDGINGLWVQMLNNRGRLTFSRGSDGDQVLFPRGRPVRFRGPRIGYSNGIDGWPRGTTVARVKKGLSIYGLLGRNGSFERVGAFTVSWTGLWSADGSAYTYTDYDTDTQWVRALDGASVQLDLPVDVPFLYLVGWESADAVILWSLDD